MAMDTAVHLSLALVGFGCSLVPLAIRLPGPLPRWGIHSIMALAMGAMVVAGMTGPARLPLAAVLLIPAAWAWYELPRRREWLHVVVDLLAMALLVLFAPPHGGTMAPDAADHAHGHGALGGTAAAPVAVFLFWLCAHGSCLTQRNRRPPAADSLSSLGMVGSMAVMGILG
ncbi:hypothetical protein F4561_005322 [Lipingzhangella halophila]|uniref:DUF5134 domain-containing protein n=1 Tax=Lipingzhangella halophila TaxID=1783352 RepID=A0A7W7RM37_9ACTN|nr:DUF5134 domain-containing protein [Lipingzhangella halophila]MBB4934502.1 hypothetical protein [Lipingzhangella halophila]